MTLAGFAKTESEKQLISAPKIIAYRKIMILNQPFKIVSRLTCDVYLPSQKCML